MTGRTAGVILSIANRMVENGSCNRMHNNYAIAIVEMITYWRSCIEVALY